MVRGTAIPLDRGLFVAQLLREQSASQVGAVDVALHLAQRDGGFRQPAVGEVNAVPGVLPALVEQSVFVGALVLHETVAVAVAVVLHPFQGPVRVGQE